MESLTVLFRYKSRLLSEKASAPLFLIPTSCNNSLKKRSSAGGSQRRELSQFKTNSERKSAEFLARKFPDDCNNASGTYAFHVTLVNKQDEKCCVQFRAGLGRHLFFRWSSRVRNQLEFVGEALHLSPERLCLGEVGGLHLHTVVWLSTEMGVHSGFAPGAP